MQWPPRIKLLQLREFFELRRAAFREGGHQELHFIGLQLVKQRYTQQARGHVSVEFQAALEQHFAVALKVYDACLLFQWFFRQHAKAPE
jgi:hypothetical protein